MKHEKSQLKALLFKAGVVQRGQFTLKNGEISHQYIDLRRTVSDPQLLRLMARLIWEIAISNAEETPELLCGVPYGAIPLTTCISIGQSLPMLIARKNQKQYGAKNRIEGIYQARQCCLLVEDVMTTGSSVLSTAQDLKAAGLSVRDVAVFVDREQGGGSMLQQYGYRLHRVFTLQELSEQKLSE